MTRRDLLPLLAAPLTAQSRRRPNLVFILVDDLRWDSLGCTGHPFVKTPHIDRIAREGANFTNAFVTTPLCSPARGSFLTGQYVHKHGVVGNRGHEGLSHKLETFPRILQASGYRTGYVGKWHMGNDDSPRPGFDRWVSFRGQGVYNDPALNIDGEQTRESGYITDILSRHAAGFIRASGDRPFCLYVGHKAIHGPFTPHPRHASLYTDEKLPRRPNYQPRGPSDEIQRNQLRCMASIDEGVGEILRALDQAGTLDDSLVMFTSDNGYFWGEHGLGDKRWAYEESIRIPMVARYPRLIRPGTTVNGMALNIDVAPTFLDAAGVAVPQTMHGASLLSQLGAKPGRWREEFLTEYFREENFPRTPTWRSVRTGEWKYVEYPDGDHENQLFHLPADPYEMSNKIEDRAAAPNITRLKRQLADLLRTTA